MSEKISPASSTSSGSMTTPLPRPANAGGETALFVRRQAPTHVFANELFQIEFEIEFHKEKKVCSPNRTGDTDTSSLNRTGDTDIEFVVTLHHFKSGRLANDDATLWMEPSTIWFTLRSDPPRKKQKVSCKIRSNKPPSSRHNKDQAECYVIRLSPKEEARASLRGLQPVTSRPIFLVNHKIKITPDEEFENIWYKDEGGRDKCMTVTASLFDVNNNLYTGERIPLQLTLCYASDPPFKVIKQDILRSLGPSNVGTDPSSGHATLRFRIEDVSKNHQDQDFKIEVAPDARTKGFKDIAPGFTPAVKVRSKRNKRHRSTPSDGKQDGRFHSPNMPLSRGFSNDDGTRMDAPFVPFSNIPRLRDAIKGVMQWTEECVNGLYPLQWQVIGYNQNPDGSPDYGRPYHNIPNPNTHISRVLSVYSDSTREQLRVLSSAVERMEQIHNESYQRASEESFGGSDGPPSGMPIQVPALQIQGMTPRVPYHVGLPSRVTHAAAPPDSFHDTDMPPQLRYPPQHTGVPPMRPAMDSMHHSMSLSRPPGRLGMHPRNTVGPLPLRHGHSVSHASPLIRSPPSPIHASLPQARLTDDASRESEVAYVLAKNFKAMRTGERLGFPAYSSAMEILGFYRESNLKVGVGQFVPISQHPEDFGPLEIREARQILEEAFEKKSEAVYALKDWGNISNLLDHALVYDWSRGEIDNGNVTNRSNSGEGIHNQLAQYK